MGNYQDPEPGETYISPSLAAFGQQNRKVRIASKVIESPEAYAFGTVKDEVVKGARQRAVPTSFFNLTRDGGLRCAQPTLQTQSQGARDFIVRRNRALGRGGASRRALNFAKAFGLTLNTCGSSAFSLANSSSVEPTLTSFPRRTALIARMVLALGMALLQPASWLAEPGFAKQAAGYDYG
jgi:hypothetical protein